MLKALEDMIDAVRSLDDERQERAAQVLRAWLDGASDGEFADV